MNDWISIHVYHFEDQDSLILKALDPAVRYLAGHGMIEQFFFVRYWMNGMHVRLRVLPSATSFEEEIKSYLEATFAEYQFRNPSRVPEALDLHRLLQHLHVLEFGTEGELSLNPDNSLEFGPYLPEFERYGGRHGVALAEWHFDFNSRLVIQVMRRFEERRHRVISLAQLCLVALVAFDYEPSGIRDFYVRYKQCWTRYLPASATKTLTQDYGSTSGEMGKFREFIDDVRERPECLSRLLQEWFAHCQLLRKKIGELQIKPSRHHVESKPDSNFSAADHLLGHYFHMMANRLGISPAQEAHLASHVANALP